MPADELGPTCEDAELGATRGASVLALEGPGVALTVEGFFVGRDEDRTIVGLGDGDTYGEAEGLNGGEAEGDAVGDGDADGNSMGKIPDGGPASMAKRCWESDCCGVHCGISASVQGVPKSPARLKTSLASIPPVMFEPLIKTRFELHPNSMKQLPSQPTMRLGISTSSGPPTC